MTGVVVVESALSVGSPGSVESVATVESAGSVNARRGRSPWWDCGRVV